MITIDLADPKTDVEEVFKEFKAYMKRVGLDKQFRRQDLFNYLIGGVDLPLRDTANVEEMTMQLFDIWKLAGLIDVCADGDYGFWNSVYRCVK
jgi:hypothetical protein